MSLSSFAHRFRVLSRATFPCIISLRRSMRRCRHSPSFTLATSPIRTAAETCTYPLLSLVDAGIHTITSDWEKILTPDADQIVSYDQLPKTADPGPLSKLAILKFNGGLGTSMGTYNIVSPILAEANNPKWQQACVVRRVPSRSRTE